MLFTDGKGTHSFFYGPLLVAGSKSEVSMKKPEPQPDNIRPLLDPETKRSVRDLLFGPKVLGELRILARLARLARKAKPAQAKASRDEDERLAA